MGGRGASGLTASTPRPGQSALQIALARSRDIAQQKMNAIRTGTNVISYETNGVTHHQYYYDGSWHGTPPARELAQPGTFNRIIESQKKRRRR